jgi:hypothetical protein
MNVRLVKNDCYDYGFEVIVGGKRNYVSHWFVAVVKYNVLYGCEGQGGMFCIMHDIMVSS